MRPMRRNRRRFSLNSLSAGMTGVEMAELVRCRHRLDFRVSCRLTRSGQLRAERFED